MFQINSLPWFAVVNLLLRFSRLSWRGVRIGWRSWIKSPIRMGRGSATGWGLTVRGSGELVVGRYCALGESIRIITSNHDMKGLSLNYLVQDRILGKRNVAGKKGVTIGNDVWIGDGAILLPGIEIGDGAVIGAGAVVTKSVAAFQIVAGNPARVIRERFPSDVIARLQSLSWWSLPEAEQKRLSSLFEDVDIEALDKLLAGRDRSGS